MKVMMVLFWYVPSCMFCVDAPFVKLSKLQLIGDSLFNSWTLAFMFNIYTYIYTHIKSVISFRLLYLNFASNMWYLSPYLISHFGTIFVIYVSRIYRFDYIFVVVLISVDTFFFYNIQYKVGTELMVDCSVFFRTRY